MELTSLHLVYVAAAAMLVGFTKTSVGGVGILAVLLMALAIPGKASPGVLLPMLIVADIFAVLYYRRHCDWKILLRLFPATAFGILIGFFVVDAIPVAIFQKAIGVIILAMVGMNLAIEKFKPTFSASPAWTWTVGLAAGVTTMVANAAGPIFGVYLLQMGLSKQEFVGTRSWYFLLVNIFKIPFSANLGLITAESLKFNLMLVPLIFLGAWFGISISQTDQSGDVQMVDPDCGVGGGGTIVVVNAPN